MAGTVQSTFWEILRDVGPHKEMAKRYIFSDMEGQQTQSVEIRIRLVKDSPSFTTKLKNLINRDSEYKPFVYLMFEPYIIEQSTAAAAQIGPANRELVEHKFLPVVVESSADGLNFVLFGQSSKDVIDALMMCRPLTFHLVSKNSGRLALLQLHNDEQFVTQFAMYRIEAQNFIL
jgi:hypothetical protein